jgi:hypothetical protein
MAARGWLHKDGCTRMALEANYIRTATYGRLQVDDYTRMTTHESYTRMCCTRIVTRGRIPEYNCRRMELNEEGNTRMAL